MTFLTALGHALEPGSGVPTPPKYSPDPFAPDPTIFPPPPPWLFPAVMILLGIAVIVVIILLYGWYRSVQISKAEQRRIRRTDWVDLSALDKRGRWSEDAERADAGAAEDGGSRPGEDEDDDPGGSGARV